MFEEENQVMREKLEEEIKMAEKKFELEKQVKRSFSKLPKVKLAPLGQLLTGYDLRICSCLKRIIKTFQMKKN